MSLPLPASALFSNLLAPQPDAALTRISAFISAYGLDTRPEKIDLGLGIYKDETGETPILNSVKAAEAKLLFNQTSKADLSGSGDQAFIDHIVWLALGQTMAGAGRLFGVQTPGGGLALRLAVALYAAAKPSGSIWVGMPILPSHESIFSSCRLNVMRHAFYDITSGRVIFETMLENLSAAKPGDAVLLHACCHNPSGAMLSRAQWDRLIPFMVAKQLIPIVDLSYHGLGEGLWRDSEATRVIFAACPEALLAYSCDKNFAMHRDRVGALIGQMADPAHVSAAHGCAIAHARASWSMLPNHAAAVIRTILDNADLTLQWREELSDRRQRLRRIRKLLVIFEPRLAYILEQQGLFVQLPLGESEVLEFARSDAIYLAPSGRANIAALNASNLERFVRALALMLDRKRRQSAF